MGELRTTGVMDSAWVYLPDDEPDSTFSYGGERYTLAPNQANEIVAYTPHLWKRFRDNNLGLGKLVAPQGVPPISMARAFENSHGKWGVCVVSGPVESTPGKAGKARTLADQAAVDAAEALYHKSTKEWAERLLLAEGEKNAKRKAAGLKEETTPEADKARRWLLTHKL